MKGKCLVLCGLLFVAPTSTAMADEGARVRAFSPQGTVKKVRQVRAAFSEPMVPLGDPRTGVDPFHVDCPEKGTGRWADQKNWIYDFHADVPGGVRCAFTARPDLASLEGRFVTGQRRFEFSTGGPAVVGATPYDGHRGIAEDQIFILSLDAEPDEASVIENAGFSIPGIEDRVGVRIVSGEERDALVRLRASMYPRPAAGGRHIILIQCRQRLPSGAKVSLVWGEGVRSRSGIPTERDQLLHFETREAFSVAFRCEREHPRAGCLPMLPMSLSFSAPLAPDQKGEAVLTGPGGKAWRAALSSGQSWVSFPGPFPPGADFRLELPPDIRDDAGRPLTNADQFPLSVRSSAYPPLAKFSARFGILERRAGAVLPVTLRDLEPQVKARMVALGQDPRGITGQVVGKLFNIPPERLEDVQPWLRRVAGASREASMLGGEARTREFTVPKPHGAKAFEVVGIPLDKPGLYVVELESSILGEALLEPPKPMFVPTAALVTNLSVHFKQGRESSLVWVTSLDKGDPVRNAVVTVKDCRGGTLWRGMTDSEGVARIEAPLPAADQLPRCPYSRDDPDASQMGALRALGGGLLVLAQTGDDMSFVHSSWTEGIERWRFKLPTEPHGGPVIAHTILDRTLLRAGESVHMKHILRRHTMAGFSTVPPAQRPDRVVIQHVGSDQTYDLPLAWDADGAAETTWAIPREAKLGGYEIVLSRGGQEEGSGGDEGEQDEEAFHDGDRPGMGGPGSWISGRFRVEEFRVPLLKGTIVPPREPLVNASEVTLDLGVRFLAGGAASQLPVRLRGGIALKPLPSFEGFEGFRFANGGVKEGLARRGQALEEETEEDPEGAPGEEEGAGPRPPALATQELVLDRAGSGRATLSGLPKGERPRELVAEMEFQDPNGEVQTVSARIPLWGARRLVGIRPDDWAASRDQVRAQVAVVDLQGRPVARAPVKVDLLSRRTLSHRKRLVGGFYAYDHAVETRRVKTLCQGDTDDRGLLLCEADCPVSGELILAAESRDEAGNATRANQSVWVAGDGQWWFEAGDHDRMDVLPERKRYEPGETARFQVRMPFREATALVAVEREGVLEARVHRLSGRMPVVELPVRDNYAPNVFVSILAVRGRVAGVPPTALADLGKPAFKMGVAEINVGWRAHELKVAVTTDRTLYKVRETARVRVKVTTGDGKAPPPGSEVALAAVDEGLLELMPNPSWDLLPPMMGRRGYEVRTATAQMHVVGKRHFGLKALPQGGGGGRQATRELFDTLLLWRARLALDDRGEASVEIPLNDVITGFRIAAVATGGTGRFGFGAATIQATQDLMVLSGLPPLVREGDRFRAGFTVRNATDRPLTVEMGARAQGMSPDPGPLAAALAPGEARELAWDVTAPHGVASLPWEVWVKAREGGAQDRLRVTQRVAPAAPVRVFQATVAQLVGQATLPVERPVDALAGGGVGVSIRPRLGDGLDGVERYMRQYPYGCMEQRVSMAVALRDRPSWDRLMAQLPSHLDGDGLLKYFPGMVWGSPVLTAYVVSIGHEARWEVPAEPLERMAAGLRKFVEGSVIRHSPLPAADLSVRKLAALEALSRIGQGDPKLLGSLSVEPNLWPTSALIDWINFLLNVERVPQRRARLAEAEQILRARLQFRGTVMGFSTEATDGLGWLMVSQDLNAVRTVLTALRLEGWREEIPRLMRGALARQRGGHWDLTLANAWGVLAMDGFSRAFEDQEVTGSTRAALGDQARLLDWRAAPLGDAMILPWPSGQTHLTLVHEGSGRPWAVVQSLAAVPLKEPLFSGYRIHKGATALERRRPEQWSRGDVLRVRLEIDAQADQTWVVVSDPIPAGAVVLGGGLGRDSRLLTRGEERKGRVWPAFEERAFEAFRAYYEYVPKGSFTVEYTMRLNQPGTLQTPPTRVEALYVPEMMGEMPNPPMEILP